MSFHKFAGIPEQTSAEALPSYPPGTQLASGANQSWQNVKVNIFSLDTEQEQFVMPAVVEPFLVWVMSGHAETKERENAQSPWKVNQVQSGSLYLTYAGAPYEFFWKRLSKEPFQVMLVTISLPLFEEALADVYGNKAAYTSLDDKSAFNDPVLIQLLQLLHTELKCSSASRLWIDSIGRAIGIHLARSYVELLPTSKIDRSVLPAYKLKQIIEWMSTHLTDNFSLATLAGLAGISEFHFNRLFKRATGVPPSQFHIKLRLEHARRQLRETDKGILEIALDVGYANPSHFARLFKKETGLSPSDYRKSL